MPSHSFTWPHPGANAVQLAGTFTDWKPIDMTKSGDGWSLTTDVPVGSHEYKFVVDGNWVHDEGQASKQNEVGSWNNAIDVKDARKEPVKRTIEVERKFIVPENYHSLLLSAGFSHVSDFSEHLVDDYYDTPSFALLRANHWLRMRNGDWELKYPVNEAGPDKKEKEEVSKTSLYHESSNPEDIALRLKGLLLNGEEEETPSLQEMAKNGSLKEFAHLETNRQCYKRDSVNVVVDEAEWGFRVGEIEVLIETEAEVSEASDKIQDIADELDFSALDLVSLKKFSQMSPQISSASI